MSYLEELQNLIDSKKPCEVCETPGRQTAIAKLAGDYHARLCHRCFNDWTEHILNHSALLELNELKRELDLYILKPVTVDAVAVIEARRLGREIQLKRYELFKIARMFVKGE